MVDKNLDYNNSKLHLTGTWPAHHKSVFNSRPYYKEISFTSDSVSSNSN